MKLTSKIRAVVLAIACFAVCLSLGSCKGAANKRAVTEVETVIGRGAKKAERKATLEEMNKGLKNAKRAYNINHPWEKCGFCGGQGLVNLPDYYGNIQYDWYGNPIRINCPNCGGYGWVRR